MTSFCIYNALDFKKITKKIKKDQRSNPVYTGNNLEFLFSQNIFLCIYVFMYPSKSTCSIDLCEDVCSQSVVSMILFLKKKFLPGTFFSSTYMVPILLLMTTHE